MFARGGGGVVSVDQGCGVKDLPGYFSGLHCETGNGTKPSMGRFYRVVVSLACVHMLQHLTVREVIFENVSWFCKHRQIWP